MVFKAPGTSIDLKVENPTPGDQEDEPTEDENRDDKFRERQRNVTIVGNANNAKIVTGDKNRVG